MQEQNIEALSNELKELHEKLNKMEHLLKFAVDRQYYFNAFFNPELKKLDNIESGGILLCGNYGNPNTGDEWMLETILDYIRRYTTKKITIMLIANRIFDPSIYLKYNVEYIHCPQTIYDYDFIEKKFETLIFGGGAIIEDSIYWEAYDYGINICRTLVDLPLRFIAHGKKVFCMGLSTSNRLENKEYIEKLQRVVNGSTFFSVRDPYSLNVMKKSGIDVEKVQIIPDIVYANSKLEKAMKRKSEQYFEKESLNIGIVYIVSEETKASFIKLLQKLEMELQLKHKKYHITLIPFYDDWHLDANFYTEISENNINISTIPYNSDIKYMIQIFQNLDVLICARYHAILLALILGIPCIPLYYDTHQHYPNKIKYLLETFGLDWKSCICMSEIEIQKNFLSERIINNDNDNISRDLIEKAKCSINEVFKIGL